MDAVERRSARRIKSESPGTPARPVYVRPLVDGRHAQMRFRAPTIDDAPAVLDVLVARDIADLGVSDFVLGDLLERMERHRDF